MNFFNFPVKRPITVLMGMFMILVLGAIALAVVPLNLMPEIDFPMLMVVVQYDGAGPEELEERVAKPLERSIKTASDIKNVRITAQQNICIVQADFNWGTDLDTAAADIREKIDMVRRYMPEGIEEPMVIQIDPSEMPVVFLHLDDPQGRLNLSELLDLANDQVAPMLERVPGVASAFPMGGLQREIQVNVSREKLKRYNLDFRKVIQSIAYQNIEQTAGEIESGPLSFRVKADAEIKDLEELENLPVGKGMSEAQMQERSMRRLMPVADPLAGEGSLSPIRLRDVAEVVDSFKEKKGLVRIVERGKEPAEGIGLAVLKETDANMVEVADRVKEELPEIMDTLPKGVVLGISFDLSEIITDTIAALRRAAVEGAILAALVLFLFLWQVRPSLIVFLSIPLSILVAFVCIYFADYTLNMMTLGGLVIALGKLVDDSIVVMENIYRHQAMGKHPHQAAEDGFREVAIAVLSATIVAVIIFLPMAFYEHLATQLFRPFAATVFFALMGSLLVAYTVVPMLASRLLKPEAIERKKKRRLIFAKVQDAYGRLLGWCLEGWGKTLSIALVIMVLTVFMGFLVPFEFIPRMIAGIYQANLKLPPGTVLEETVEVVDSIQEDMRKLPDYERLMMIIGQSGDPMRAAFRGGEMGTNESEIMIKMKKKAEGRTTTDSELRRMWDRISARLPNARINFMQAGTAETEQGKPIVIKIFGDDLGVLKSIAAKVKKSVEPVAGVRDVTTTMEEGTPEYVVNINRDKLMGYGLPTGAAMADIKTAMGGQLASLYRESGKEIDITVRLKEEERDAFRDLGRVPLHSPYGFHVPLKDVARFEFGEGPTKIERENSKRVAKVETNKTDRALGDIINDIQGVLEDVPVPEGYNIEFGGEYEDMVDAFIALAIMFAAAILLVYMILASLYESLIHPVTIMIAVPLAFTGAIAGLYITGVAFGVTAFIGIIMLVGIVATNSIVLMDFIISYHRQGVDRTRAIIEAGKARLRPILMTAMTTLFGVLPIALGRAEGMELQQPLGIVVVGGLFTSTFLTLIIIPVMYQIFDDLVMDLKKLFKRT